MARNKLKKFGIQHVEFMWDYASREDYDHPTILIKTENDTFRVVFQRHRLVERSWNPISAYDVMCYRTELTRIGSALWDVGSGPYSLAYAGRLDDVQFSAQRLQFFADLAKVLDDTEIVNPTGDPMIAYYQKFTTLGADVRLRYVARGMESYDSPYLIPDQYRGHTRVWAHSPEACRLMAEHELKEAERKEAQRKEQSNNQEVV